MIILAIISMIGIAMPAMAGDWVAALEKDIIYAQNLKQAMMDAEKSGANKEDIFIASLSIIESYQIEIDWKLVCEFMGCCHSPHGACGYRPECEEACKK